MRTKTILTLDGAPEINGNGSRVLDWERDVLDGSLNLREAMGVAARGRWGQDAVVAERPEPFTRYYSVYVNHIRVGTVTI